VPACGLASRARAASGIMSAGIMAGARGASAGLGQAQGGQRRRGPRPRKPGPKPRQDKTWREPWRSAERRARPQQMVLRKRTICGALPRPWRRRVATSVLRGADTLPLRLSALRLPSFFGGEKIVELLCACKLGRDRAARTRSLAPSAPAIAGEGDHWSSRSERTVVEGAPDSELRCRCRKFSSQKRQAKCLDITKTLASR
jgi:hypothetical protein